MNEVKKLLFIINKRAGTGYKTDIESQIKAACQAKGVEYVIEFTKGVGHATELAEQGLSKNFDCIVAVGGDGTVNEVARGLVHKGIPMGVIPKGSGNGFARHLGISMNLSEALDQLLTGKIIASDTFLVNGRLSINVSGIGFDGHIANLFSQVKQRGLWGYTKLVLQEYFRYPEFSIDLETGETSKRYEAFIVAIANSSQYGNNARVAPLAKVSDHLLQSIFLKKVSLMKGLPFAFNLFQGRLRNNSTYYCGTIQHAVFKTSTPVAYHVDGEASGFAQEFKIELLAGSLAVIVPKELPNNI